MTTTKERAQKLVAIATQSANPNEASVAFLRLRELSERENVPLGLLFADMDKLQKLGREVKRLKKLCSEYQVDLKAALVAYADAELRRKKLAEQLAEREKKNKMFVGMCVLFVLFVFFLLGALT